MNIFHGNGIICQWTMLAAPKHPLFKKALDQSIQNLRELNFQYQSSRDVLSSTGPFFFTSIAKNYLPLSDTLVLDMEVFGSNPKTLPVSEKSVVEHQFHGEHGWTLGVMFPHITLS